MSIKNISIWSLCRSLLLSYPWSYPWKLPVELPVDPWTHAGATSQQSQGGPTLLASAPSDLHSACWATPNDYTLVVGTCHRGPQGHREPEENIHFHWFSCYFRIWGGILGICCWMFRFFWMSRLKGPLVRPNNLIVIPKNLKRK